MQISPEFWECMGILHTFIRIRVRKSGIPFETRGLHTEMVECWMTWGYLQLRKPSTPETFVTKQLPRTRKVRSKLRAMTDAIGAKKSGYKRST